MSKLRGRRTDTLLKAAAAFDEAYDKIQEPETTSWAIGTMQPLDKTYTRITFEEGDRIKNQLDKSLNSSSKSADFRYQGSVTNDTHIKVHSDLDLLVIDTDFETIEPPGAPSYPYAGDPVEDLKKLRAACVTVIKKEFPAVKVDDTPGKCIALSGGSLRREIDVVISNWWNTTLYQQHNIEVFRGVKVLDKVANKRHENKPFYHNALIQIKDDETAGNLRKVARLLKSHKYDSDTPLTISSYDVVSIAWNMPKEYLLVPQDQELQLVENARNYLKWLLDNDTERNSIKVPNGMRAIFGPDGTTKSQLSALHSEVDDTAMQIRAELMKSYRTIRDAKIRH